MREQQQVPVVEQRAAGGVGEREVRRRRDAQQRQLQHRRRRQERRRGDERQQHAQGDVLQKSSAIYSLLTRFAQKPRCRHQSFEVLCHVLSTLLTSPNDSL